MKRHGQQTHAGFSLVEILTVLVVIGLMSSVVFLTLPPENTAVQKQAEALNLQINALARQSLISGHNTAIGVSKSGYAFYRLAQDDWKLEKEGQWESRAVISMQREGQSVPLPKTVMPMVFFEASGMSTPFRLILEEGVHSWTIENTGNGRMFLAQAEP